MADSESDEEEKLEMEMEEVPRPVLEPRYRLRDVLLMRRWQLRARSKSTAAAADESYVSEHFVHVRSLKQRLTQYFIKNQRSSLRIRIFNFAIKILSCVLYVGRVLADDNKHCPCFPTNCKSHRVPRNDTDESIYRIHWQLIYLVQRPFWLWICQILVAILSLSENVLVTYLSYKGNIAHSLLSITFIIECITSIPFFVTIFKPMPLQCLFVPVFLNCWLAKVQLENMFGDLNRVLQRHSTVLSQQIMKVVSTIACILFTCVCGVQHIQRGGHRQLSLFESMYLVTITMSTVGYGDYKPDIWLSQLLLIAMIGVMLIALPSQLERLVSALNERNKLGASYSRHRAKTEKHVVLCLSHLKNDQIMDFLNEFYSHTMLNDYYVVLLAPCEMNKSLKVIFSVPMWSERIIYIQGSCLKVADLARCRMQDAFGCFILTSRSEEDRNEADKNTILRSWAVKDYAPKVAQYIQLFTPEFKFHVRFAEHVICEEEFKYAILANNTLFPGISTLISLLVHTSRGKEGQTSKFEWHRKYGKGSGNEVYHIAIKKSRIFGDYIGKTFTQCSFLAHKKHGVCLVAVAAGVEEPILLNPGDRTMKKDDICFYLAISKEENMVIVRSPTAAAAAAIQDNLLDDLVEEEQGTLLKKRSKSFNSTTGAILLKTYKDVQAKQTRKMSMPGEGTTQASGTPVKPATTAVTAASGSASVSSGGGGGDGGAFSGMRGAHPNDDFVGIGFSNSSATAAATPTRNNEIDRAGLEFSLGLGFNEGGGSCGGGGPGRSDIEKAAAGAVAHATSPGTNMGVGMSRLMVPGSCDADQLSVHSNNSGMSRLMPSRKTSVISISEHVPDFQINKNYESEDTRLHDLIKGYPPFIPYIGHSQCSCYLQNQLPEMCCLRHRPLCSHRRTKVFELIKKDAAKSSTGGGVDGGGGIASNLASHIMHEQCSLASYDRPMCPKIEHQLLMPTSVSSTFVALQNDGDGGVAEAATHTHTATAAHELESGDELEIDNDTDKEQHTQYKRKSAHANTLYEIEECPAAEVTSTHNVTQQRQHQQQQKLPHQQKPMLQRRLKRDLEDERLEKIRNENQLSAMAAGYYLKNCLIVCAEMVSPGLFNFIVPLRSHWRQKRTLRPILLLLENAPDEFFLETMRHFPLIYWMRGSIDNLDDLLIAGIKLADYVVVVNKFTGAMDSILSADCNTIVHMQSLFRLFPEIKVITELKHTSNMRFAHFGPDVDSYAMKMSQIERAERLRGSHMSYIFRLPFAAGSVFSANMLDTLLYQAFVKNYLIKFIRLLLGIDQMAGSGHLSCYQIEKELDLKRFDTYGKFYRYMIGTTREIPIGLYRTELQGGVMSAAAELERKRSGSSTSKAEVDATNVRFAPRYFDEELGEDAEAEAQAGDKEEKQSNVSSSHTLASNAVASDDEEIDSTHYIGSKMNNDVYEYNEACMVYAHQLRLAQQNNPLDNREIKCLEKEKFSYVLINPASEEKLMLGDLIYLIKPASKKDSPTNQSYEFLPRTISSPLGEELSEQQQQQQHGGDGGEAAGNTPANLFTVRDTRGGHAHALTHTHSAADADLGCPFSSLAAQNHRSLMNNFRRNQRKSSKTARHHQQNSVKLRKSSHPIKQTSLPQVSIGVNL